MTTTEQTTGQTTEQPGSAAAGLTPSPTGHPGPGPGDPPVREALRTGRRAALGRYGEDVAARHLVAQGMTVLDRNWRCAAGEIDLVLRDGDDLVVAEVKTRSSASCGTPHEAVTAAKLARLRRLAAAWLAAHQARPRGVRIDLVAVLRPARGPAVVDHVRGLG